LSQWSLASNADGPANLARTSVPVTVLDYTADQSVFPSTNRAWLDAAGERATYLKVENATHYLTGQPDRAEFVADAIAAWIEAL
jgi:alpha-beta hydrolase superfamily lysophospholipase